MRLALRRAIAVDLHEARRYLHAGADPQADRDLEQAVPTLLDAAAVAAVAAVFPLGHRSDGTPMLAQSPLEGAAIRRHLDGCEQVALLAVTLGFEVDRLIARAGQHSPYQALLLDACATAAVEDLADHATACLCDAFSLCDRRLTRRFSPGYGDLPLAVQPVVLDLLDARRAIGLTVSGSLMLSPCKSVTALLGLTADGCAATVAPHGCAACSMREHCAYRA